MTDKEKIKAIIQQYANKGEILLEESYAKGEHASTTGYWDGYTDCAKLLLKEIDSLQEEPVSEELIIELKSIVNIRELAHQGIPVIKIARHIANWQKEKDQETIKLAEDHAILAGMNKMKEEMMKDAVDETVHVDAGGYPYIPQMELYDYDKDVPLAKEGDKYKVILIKED